MGLGYQLQSHPEPEKIECGPGIFSKGLCMNQVLIPK